MNVQAAKCFKLFEWAFSRWEDILVKTSNGLSCLSDLACDRLECINLIDSLNDCLNSHFFELPWGNYGTKTHHRTFYSELKLKRYLLIAIYRAAGLIVIFWSNALVCQIGRVYSAFLLRQIEPLWTIKSLMTNCYFNQATAYYCFRESGIKWVLLLQFCDTSTFC